MKGMIGGGRCSSSMLPAWLLLVVASLTVILQAPLGIVVMWEYPGERCGLVKRPDTRWQVELSPIHTPHWSYTEEDPTTPSQPRT